MAPVQDHKPDKPPAGYRRRPRPVPAPKPVDEREADRQLVADRETGGYRTKG